MVWIFISVRILDSCGLHCLRSEVIWSICVRLSSSFWISPFNSNQRIEWHGVLDKIHSTRSPVKNFLAKCHQTEYLCLSHVTAALLSRK